VYIQAAWCLSQAACKIIPALAHQKFAQNGGRIALFSGLETQLLCPTIYFL
jgi:hypothetical protein